MICLHIKNCVIFLLDMVTALVSVLRLILVQRSLDVLLVRVRRSIQCNKPKFLNGPILLAFCSPVRDHRAAVP